ncbi:hypothetical protein ACRAWF_32425 [Streptomyces sp. L7]
MVGVGERRPQPQEARWWPPASPPAPTSCPGGTPTSVRELLDSTHIDKYGTTADTRLLTGSDVHSNNSTKATPTLSWRHPRRLAGGGRLAHHDNTAALRIYSTPS